MLVILFIVGVMALYCCRGWTWFIGLLLTLICGSLVLTTLVKTVPVLFSSFSTFLQMTLNFIVLIISIVWFFSILERWR